MEDRSITVAREESPLLLLSVRVDTVNLDDRRALREVGGDDDLQRAMRNTPDRRRHQADNAPEQS